MATGRTEDYLETLEEIISKKGFAQVKDVATSLQINPSSVTEMLQKLHKQGFIHYEKYSGVTLTKKGERLAIKTRKKHIILKQFFELIGVPENIAEEDACKIEHVINKITVDQLTKYVENLKSSD